VQELLVQTESDKADSSDGVITSQERNHLKNCKCCICHYNILFQESVNIFGKYNFYYKNRRNLVVYFLSHTFTSIIYHK
jgi:hypothetical protein